jgi:hypothetical protein
MENQHLKIVTPFLDIPEDANHPYLETMARYHWENGMPFVYTNTNGEVVAQWRDGSIDNLESIDNYEEEEFN